MSVDKSLPKLWLDSILLPRETIQEIVDHDPSHAMIANITAMTAMTVLVSVISGKVQLGSFTLLTVLLVPVAIMLYLYVMSWLCALTGKALGGAASAEVFRATIIWLLPATFVYNVLDVLIKQLFANQLLSSVVFFVGFVWLASISIRFISQVQGFTIGRAAVNYFLPMIGLTLLTIVVILLITDSH